MKLTRALKEKNRLIKKITSLRNKIMTSNVALEGNEFLYNMTNLQEEYDGLIEILINLKVAIQIANQPILKKIYTLSELKSTISMVDKMDTKEGQHESPGYGSTELRTYKAQYNKQQLDVDIATIQSEIDDFQDEIDEFNATATIDFELPKK